MVRILKRDWKVKAILYNRLYNQELKKVNEIVSIICSRVKDLPADDLLIEVYKLATNVNDPEDTIDETIKKLKEEIIRDKKKLGL